MCGSPDAKPDTTVDTYTYTYTDTSRDTYSRCVLSGFGSSGYGTGWRNDGSIAIQTYARRSCDDLCCC